MYSNVQDEMLEQQKNEVIAYLGKKIFCSG